MGFQRCMNSYSRLSVNWKHKIAHLNYFHCVKRRGKKHSWQPNSQRVKKGIFPPCKCQSIGNLPAPVWWLELTTVVFWHTHAFLQINCNLWHTYSLCSLVWPQNVAHINVLSLMDSLWINSSNNFCLLQVLLGITLSDFTICVIN